MKHINSAVILLLGYVFAGAIHADSPKPSNSISYPTGWENWPALAVSYREDNDTIRLIIGNPLAVKAARGGQTEPWPDGAVLGKVVWKVENLSDWSAAKVPGAPIHAEFMFKDIDKYQETFGWGWGRWLGRNQQPFSDGGKTCVACHAAVKDKDWVFSKIADFPSGK